MIASVSPYGKLASFCDLFINEPNFLVCCDQAMSQKEAEKAAVTEKLVALQQDLATADMKLEHMQREALSKQEQNKVIYNRVILDLVKFLVL